jgi:hypothetical protein
LDLQSLIQERNVFKRQDVRIGSPINSGFFSLGHNQKVILCTQMEGIFSFDISTKELLQRNERKNPDKLALSHDGELMALAESNFIQIIDEQALDSNKFLFSDQEEKIVQMNFSVDKHLLVCVKANS